MKAALVWTKNNPIAVVAAFLCAASLITLLVVHVQGATLKSTLESRDSDIKRIRALLRTSVQVPAQDLDKPPQMINIVVNKQTILDLKEVYGRMSEEYANIFDLAVDFNRGRHLTMLPGLFPDPKGDDFKRFEARANYRQAFKEMFLPHSQSALYPRLDAGAPLDSEQVAEEIDRIVQEYLQSLFPRRSSIDQLSAEELEQLELLKKDGLRNALASHYEKFHIYANSNQGSDGYPFEVGKWSEPGPKPTMEQIWEGQMGLWVQQDIVEAIQHVNQVWSPASNVVTAPIKRLVKIELVPGYVGITSGGGMGGGASPSFEAAVSGEKRLPDDFSKAPTGRRSNSIYDVQHVWLTIDVDYQRLPAVFEALARTNFMSVLQIELEDVDEYEMLENGYVYGTQDVVSARILIETLWLREWTAELMPRRLRARLGIPDEQADGNGAAIPPGVDARN